MANPEGKKYSSVTYILPKEVAFQKKFVAERFRDNYFFRKGDSFFQYVKDRPIELSLSKHKDERKLYLPDFAQFVTGQVFIASEKFYELISPLTPDFVEWIPIGSLSRRKSIFGSSEKIKYFILNFTKYPEFIDLQNSRYTTFRQQYQSVAVHMENTMSHLLTPDNPGIDLDSMKKGDLGDERPWSFQDYIFFEEEVQKCPIFPDPYLTFGLTKFFLSETIVKIIEQNQLRIDGDLRLIYTSLNDV